MTYDFVSEEDREELAELEVGTVHKIEAVYPGGDRENRADLYVTITEVAQ